MHILGMAALLGALALAPAAGAQDRGQAPHGPLYRIPGADIFSWMTAPERTPDGRIRFWHWVITHGLPGAEVDANGYAFLNEVDCEAGTLSRQGREWWFGHRLVRVIPEYTPHRVWPDVFQEASLVRVVCDSQPLGGRVEDTDQARALVPRD